MRIARTLAAACLAVAALLGVVAAPASALEPPRPLPGYRPAFVTETDVRPWTDCLWASGAMLLDKWTNGDETIGHRELRRLSGDDGPSSLEDLQVAFRRLGFALQVQGQGDGVLTWSQLISRLRHGAGAVVLGDDSLLPRWYGRWDYAFWKKHGKKDNHAVYVERYERGRVWIMDPLARGGWKGEWISAAALRKFAWFTGGRVAAVTTPTAKPAPFKGVRALSPQIGVSAGAITASWRLRTPRHWRFPRVDLHVAIRKTADPVAGAVRTAQLHPVATLVAAPVRPTASVGRDKRLRLTTPLPAKPGAYTATMSLSERRFGRTVLRSDPVSVFVPGPRRATLRLNLNGQVLTAGGGLKLNLTVTNSGQLTWADPAAGDSGTGAPARGAARPRHTRVTALWVRLDRPTSGRVDPATSATSPAAKQQAVGGPWPVALAGRGQSGTILASPAGTGTGPGDAAGRRGAGSLQVELARVPLPAGRMARIRKTLVVPEQVGRWALVIDLVDDVDGTFSALGSAPTVALFEVVAPRGIVPIE